MPALKHVLIAIDFGEVTEPLLECARDLEALGAERFTLVHVEPVGYPAAPRVTHRGAYEARLREAAEKLRGKGVAVQIALRSGLPGSEIVAAAEELQADLIVLAAHDHGTLRRGLIGSVASDALHHASVPVLLQRFTREEAASPEACGLRCGAILRRPLLATDGSASARNAEEMTPRAYLRTLPRHLRLTFEEGRAAGAEPLQVLLVHGSPRKVNEYLFEDRNDASFLRMMRAADADVLCFGHTHKPYHRSIADLESLRGARHAVNIGSVGKPKDGDPRSCYAVLDIDPARDQPVEVTLVRVEYDLEKAARAVEESRLPDAFSEALRLAR